MYCQIWVPHQEGWVWYFRIRILASIILHIFEKIKRHEVWASLTKWETLGRRIQSLVSDGQRLIGDYIVVILEITKEQSPPSFFLNFIFCSALSNSSKKCFNKNFLFLFFFVSELLWGQGYLRPLISDTNFISGNIWHHKEVICRKNAKEKLMISFIPCLSTTRDVEDKCVTLIAKKKYSDLYDCVLRHSGLFNVN